MHEMLKGRKMKVDDNEETIIVSNNYTGIADDMTRIRKHMFSQILET